MSVSKETQMVLHAVVEMALNNKWTIETDATSDGEFEGCGISVEELVECIESVDELVTIRAEKNDEHMGSVSFTLCNDDEEQIVDWVTGVPMADMLENVMDKF